MLYNEYMVKRKQNWSVRVQSSVIVDLMLVIMLLFVCFLLVFMNSGIEGKINFSLATGIYNSDVSIVLSRDRIVDNLSEYKIRYTLDGNEVKYDSLDGEQPVYLTAPEKGYNAFTIRTALCSENHGCKKSYYATYVLGKNISEDTRISIINLVSPYEGLYDYEKGIMVPGRKYDEGILEAYETGKYMFGNYYERGKDWIRDAHMTMFDENGKTVYDNDIGIMVSGGTSSEMEVKSLKLISKNESELFSYSGKQYETLRLRNGSQDYVQGNIRSSVVSRLAEESGFKECPGTMRAVVFLNNKYYGIFDIQQPFSASFFSNDLSIGRSRMVEKYKGSENDTLKTNGLYELFDHDVWNEDAINRLESAVDIDDYLLYYSVQIMWNNMDWLTNNYGLWKYTGAVDRDSDNGFEDGRYRFFMYDTDIVYYSANNIQFFNGADGDILVDIMENGRLAKGNTFRKIMGVNSYREKFIDILRELVNGAFKTENVVRVIDEEAAKIDRQVELFNSDEYENWQKWIELLKATAAKREDEVRADVKKYFGVDL